MYNTYRVDVTLDNANGEVLGYGFNSIIDPEAKNKALTLFDEKSREMKGSNIFLVEFYMNNELIMWC